MGRRAGFVAAAIAFAAVAGCSLLTSTDGLSGAETTGSEGGPAEAGESESGSVVDGGNATAETGADADAGPYCATLSPAPKYCADFDDGLITDFGNPMGAPSLDTSNAKSPPRSIACTVTADAGKRYSEIERPFGDTPTSFDGSFDVFVDQYDPAKDVELVTVHLNSTGLSCNSTVSIRNSLWTIDEYCESGASVTVSSSHSSNHVAALGTWVHVDFAVSFMPARTQSLAVDGKTYIAGLPLQAGFKTGAMFLSVGIAYVQLNAGDAKVHLDNVRFDYR